MELPTTASRFTTIAFHWTTTTNSLSGTVQGNNGNSLRLRRRFLGTRLLSGGQEGERWTFRHANLPTCWRDRVRSYEIPSRTPPRTTIQRLGNSEKPHCLPD